MHLNMNLDSEFPDDEYMELDSERWQLKVISFFKDGKIAYAYDDVECDTFLADAQYLVCKYDENGATRTEVTRLSDDQRAQEIARMVGGAACESESSVRHAAVMLAEAKERKQVLRTAINK